MVGVIAAAFFALLVGWVVFRSPALGFAGFAIILGSTAEFWLGTTFAIDAKGARSRTGFSLTEIEWENVKRVIPENGGIRLSPLERAGTLDTFRGVFLRFGVDNRDEIEEAVLKFGGLRGGLLSAPNGGGDGEHRGEDGVGDRPAGSSNAGDSIS
jgi:hypothetical protein